MWPSKSDVYDRMMLFLITELEKIFFHHFYLLNDV